MAIRFNIVFMNASHDLIAINYEIKDVKISRKSFQFFLPKNTRDFLHSFTLVFVVFETFAYLGPF